MSNPYSRITVLAIIAILQLQIYAQEGVSVSVTNAPPHASAMLDVQSDAKGVLVPRLSTLQREGIATPAVGLLVFDTNSASFWYNTGSGWVELVNNLHGLRDLDNDTKVQVEESPDEDRIRFDIGGVKAMVLEESSQGATRLDIGPDIGLIIGHDAAVESYAGWNTILGYQAGQFTTTGERNVFIGYQAGQNNGPGQDRNVLIGYRAGRNNNAWGNTMIGYQSGIADTTGHSNSFLGYQSGVQNTTGYRNTFIGQQAGHNNEVSYENTFVGFNAGYNNEASRNTFVGQNAGKSNRTGQFNVVLGMSAAGSSISNRDMGDGNAIIGYEAGLFANGMAYNVLAGYHAGYNLTTGNGNVFLGQEAGRATTDAHSNVAIGIDALRTNIFGHRNVAIGDSSLLSNTASGNVAVGSKAGMGNTSGGANTFIGQIAGTNNSTGNRNTMLGWKAGNFNSTGDNNVFIGAESANANSTGEDNSFLGYAAGFRNDEGSNNVFLGYRSGEFNVDGISNIAIGSQAMNVNSNGAHNTAIGELALGRQDNGSYLISDNIGIGYRAGLNIVGSSNIIIGNNSGAGMVGIDNVVLGHDVDPGGMSNTFLGTESGVDIFSGATHSTAIGHGTILFQDRTVVLGNSADTALLTGIGTHSPDAKLHISSAGSIKGLRVNVGGSTKLTLNTNGGLTVGSGDLNWTSDNGLRVQGRSRIGHPTSIDHGPNALFYVYGLSEFYEKAMFFEETTVSDDLNVTGNIVVGATPPTAKVGIKDDGWQLAMTNSNAPGNNWYFGASSSSWIVNDNNLLVLSPTTSSTDGIIYVDRVAAAVGINTGDIPSGYALAVKGDIITERVRVELLGAWPDYVFEADYDNPKLEEVADYISEHGHLPGMPSAKEVATDGVELGEMQRLLLEKVEQLTLHMIDLQMENEQMRMEMDALKLAQK